MLFNTGGTVILVDPVFNRASLVPLIGEPFAVTQPVVIKDLPGPAKPARKKKPATPIPVEAAAAKPE